LGAFWFSIISANFWLGLIFAVLEFNALLLFFCNSFPIGKASAGSMQGLQNQAMAAAAKAQFSALTGSK